MLTNIFAVYIVLLLCHLVGDFILQKDWSIAIKNDIKSILKHTFIYSIPLLIPSILVHSTFLDGILFFFINSIF
jgi:hypothetical protein